ncbi:hypothetical protein OOT00_07785 [Desulfobotulus sp. H1]|uniref:Uncharacterized protein n=1 Tax=Desulfobotulus pelophilus TaxID=2823377 RepID=A0ABT3N8V0_9BACT|nr:hypothetical protein [Desulfobotulus pelophilus]MCW7753882.1 hypothetical protein [Desulfobotulus pelophilus]
MFSLTFRSPDYDISVLQPRFEGSGHIQKKELRKWADEVKIFSERMESLSGKAKILSDLFAEASLPPLPNGGIRQLKKELFAIHDLMTQALDIAGRIESELIQTGRH